MTVPQGAKCQQSLRLEGLFRLMLCVCSVIILAGCSSETKDINGSFDRGRMLQFMADNYIIPSYVETTARVVTLDNAVNAFLEEPTSATLQTARTAWGDAYELWQKTQHFDFGPAETSSGTLLQNVGTYPVNTALIESYISLGDTSFNNFNRDTRGFLAAEYLLFSGTSLDSVSFRFNGSSASNRRAYLRSVIRDIRTRLTATRDSWQTRYRSEFIEATGTDVASSTTKLFNGFVASYENLKNFKFGVPLGRRAGQAGIDPEKVEAYFSGASLRFARAHFRSIEDIWGGLSLSGERGSGFRDYIQSVVGGEALIQNTIAQANATRSMLNALNSDPLQTQIRTNFTAVNNTHTELQRLTRFYKSDMASLLGLSITFSSNDGD